MKHGLLPILLLILLGISSSNAQVYNIIPDGDPSDWEANDGTYDNTSLSVHASGIFNSQWIYKGEAGDQRTDGDDPDSNYDITEVRIGASSSTLYVLIRMDNITDIGLPIVSLAMADSNNPGGFDYIGDGADTGTAGGSHLNNNATNVIDIHDPNDNGADPEFNTGFGFTNKGTAVISTTHNCIEYAINFADMNGSISQMSMLNIAIISGQDNDFFANNGDAFREITNSDGIDGMTPGVGSGNFYGRAGGVGASDFDVESAGVSLSNANLLPVEFTAVVIETTAEGHHVSWSTAFEINNKHFEVQRSIDSKNWESIVLLDGAGTTNERRSYQAIDKNPQKGRNYYRVKQVDYDGAFSYSPIVSGVWKQAANIGIGPVPVKDQLNITGLTEIETPLWISVFNNSGQKIKEELYQGTVIDFKEVPDGIYFIQFKTFTGIIATKQFVVQH